MIANLNLLASAISTT